MLPLPPTMPLMRAGQLPEIIQGGMGVAVSGWELARAVSRAGQFGVVSGTALDVVLVRRLQEGDPGGHVRRAAATFPVPDVADEVVERYFIPGGKDTESRYRLRPMAKFNQSRHLLDLLVLANYVEVYLAKEGHDGWVGINLLTKVQAPTVPSLYGAMLAGVDAVLMGAGIPREIPEILDRLAAGKRAALKLAVKGASRDEVYAMDFDPVEYCRGPAPAPRRPLFFPIVASAVLAKMLVTKASGRVDGFVVEGPSAGGHNAPPRGKLQLNARGEPVYGDRDVIDLAAIAEIGLPFWLAGSFAEPGRLQEARALGATGIQVGTAFAYCAESGLDETIKAQVLAKSSAGDVAVFTDPVASPTGFPFKVVPLEDTMSEETVYEKRTRVCDLGYLRTPYRREDGSVGWRCPAEPIADFVAKGGDEADTVGRKCVCNALLASIGMGQIQRNGEYERPLVTSGDDVAAVARFLPPGADTYSATDVIDYLLRDADES
jgi:nitronate monooxygenase